MSNPSPPTTDAATSDRGSSCARCSLARVGAPSVKDLTGAEDLTCVCEWACGASGCLAPSPAAASGLGTRRDMDLLWADMRRWVPAETAVAHAKALLGAEPRAELAYIPMCLPGKTRGVWDHGQEVITVIGVVLISVYSFRPAGEIPSASWARATAAAIARRALDVRGEQGVSAYATVRRDGHVAVFEDTP